MIFNQQLDAYLTLFFVIVLWTVILDMLRVAYRHQRGLQVPPVSESPHQPSRLVEDWARD